MVAFDWTMLQVFPCVVMNRSAAGGKDFLKSRSVDTDRAQVMFLHRVHDLHVISLKTSE